MVKTVQFVQKIAQGVAVVSPWLDSGGGHRYALPLFDAPSAPAKISVVGKMASLIGQHRDDYWGDESGEYGASRKNKKPLLMQGLLWVEWTNFIRICYTPQYKVYIPKHYIFQLPQ